MYFFWFVARVVETWQNISDVFSEAVNEALWAGVWSSGSEARLA